MNWEYDTDQTDNHTSDNNDTDIIQWHILHVDYIAFLFTASYKIDYDGD